MITVTPKAAQEIKTIMEQQGIKEGGLRVGVRGGGCSGLSYSLSFAKEAQPDDQVLDQEGITLYVDMKSLLYLDGVTLDFMDGLMGRGFVFNNPNATNTCGCGSSFSA
jgi:iron-sulfur cluster assembly protein